VQLYIPFGIENPRNHCYLNSIPQVLFVIFHQMKLHSFDCNEKGKITKLISYLSSLDAHSAFSIVLLKTLLANCNLLLDDRRQHDAKESLIIVMDIIHAGTKWALIAGDNLPEDLVISFKTSVFSSISG